MGRTVLLLASTALALLLSCGVLLAGVEKPARAAFPGGNGKIVFSNDDEIFSMNSDGSGQRQLTDAPGFDLAPAVSPDGTRIAFASSRDGGGFDIYVMDADGGNQTNLTKTPTVQEVHPSWSPDGKKMAFERYQPEPREVWTMDADGSHRVGLGEGLQPDWSPDGTKIAFAVLRSYYDSSGEEQTYFSLYTMSPNGSDRAYVTGGFEPDWSPDGKKLAGRVREGGTTSSVFTVNADGSGFASVYSMAGEDTYDPSWSPDGTKMVYGMYGIDGPGIIVSKADGSDGRTFAGYAESLDGGPAPTDATAPVVSGPTRSLAAGSVIGDSAAPVRLTWSATDGGSGVARYELQRSVNGGTFAGVALPSQTATAVTESLGAGKGYQYRVRAQDRAGNWSAWKTGSAFSVDLRQETHQAITYAGGPWALRSSPTASGGYAKSASAPGAKARFSFAGKNVAWVASAGSNRGKAEVWVDGAKAATVDLYAATAQPRKVQFAKSWGTSGNHTLEVRILGTKNAASSGKQADVDAFVALR